MTDVALLVGTSKSYIWELENHPINIGADLLYKIASAIGCPMEYLLDRDELDWFPEEMIDCKDKNPTHVCKDYDLQEKCIECGKPFRSEKLG